MKSIKIFLLFVSMFTLSMQALASGGGGYGGGAGGGGGGYGGNTQPITDPLYEYGKSVFSGRVVDLKVCLSSDSSEAGVTKVKKKYLKQYKQTSYQTLAGVLVDCKNPQKLAADVLKRDDMLSMLYYLDKRFKLKLES